MFLNLFICQFFNSYASFFYIAFIEKPLGLCGGTACMSTLASDLGTIFGIQLISSPLSEIIIAYVTQIMARRKYKYTSEMLKKASEIEKQFLHAPVKWFVILTALSYFIRTFFNLLIVV